MLTSLRFTSIFLIGLLFLAFNSQDASADDRFSKASFLGQGDEPWKIRARIMSYSDREGIYDAEGDVVISRGEEALYAQKARYNMKTGIAEVEGDVRMESGGDILTGEKGVFDFKKQTGKIINGSLFLKDNHFYIMGGLMEKLGENTYLVRDCRVTTCDGENPTWSISGSEVKVTVEGYGTVRNAALRIRNIPVLYVPYMIFPAKTKRQTGLLPPRVGHSSRNGTDAGMSQTMNQKGIFCLISFLIVKIRI
jgi:LPS-assembly protein